MVQGAGKQAHQEELGAVRVVARALERVRDAGREVPEVALVNRRDVVPAVLVDGGDLG